MAGSLNPQQLAQTKAAAKDFEAVFVSEMMSHMFEGIETDPVFGGGQGEDIFRGMLIQEYGKQMAKGPGIGISDQLQKVMIQMQQQRRG
jgi:Rod binding domain-containing protein